MTKSLPPHSNLFLSKNGATHVYWDYPFWDTQKKYGNHLRLYIGKVDIGGNFIPNRYYLSLEARGEVDKPPEFVDKAGREKSINEMIFLASQKSAANDVSVKTNIEELYYGGSHLLNEISMSLGVEHDLSQCFPDCYKEILSIAYYNVLQPHSAPDLFWRWAYDHQHPCGTVLTSQSISNLINYQITEQQKQDFFKTQIQRRKENEYLGCDISTVSSYSELIKSVRYGRNKDHEKLPQINLALVVGEVTRIPACYRMLPGNISDVTTLRKIILDMDYFNIEELRFVLDRGFYSADNIKNLLQHNHLFILGARRRVGYIENYIEKAKKILSSNRTSAFNTSAFNYDKELKVYFKSYDMRYTDEHFDNNNHLNIKEHLLKVHVYLNKDRAEDERHKFHAKINDLEIKIKDKARLTDDEESLKNKYFIETQSSKRYSNTIKKNRSAIMAKADDFGYSVLLTNENIPFHDILSNYRQKDVVEKAFDNFKDRLGLKRTEVHSDRALDNKIFISFISLIYISAIDKEMKSHKLYKNMTMDNLLANLDVIKICCSDGENHYFSEVTKKQRELYIALGVNPPT
ncbi:MAG: IS1634 family transposase [Deltaproteobacteria bacterium]|jgi:transposase|nr:IS1634 family transposase [Deltaproteobacteria bacterium]